MYTFPSANYHYNHKNHKKMDTNLLPWTRMIEEQHWCWSYLTIDTKIHLHLFIHISICSLLYLFYYLFLEIPQKTCMLYSRLGHGIFVRHGNTVHAVDIIIDNNCSVSENKSRNSMIATCISLVCSPLLSTKIHRLDDT